MENENPHAPYSSNDRDDINGKGTNDGKSMENIQSSRSASKHKKKEEMVVHIGTRRSELARRQTAIVEEALRQAWRRPDTAAAVAAETTMATAANPSDSTISTETSSPSLSSSEFTTTSSLETAKDIDFIVHAMSTAGDKNQVTALHEFGAKALWTQELEVGLLEGSLDMVVHSLKGEWVSW